MPEPLALAAVESTQDAAAVARVDDLGRPDEKLGGTLDPVAQQRGEGAGRERRSGRHGRGGRHQCDDQRSAHAQFRAPPSPWMRSRIWSGGFSMICEKRTTVTVSSIETLRP